MGHIPSDAEWYIAEVVMEITVHGAQRNALHRNLVLINAHSPHEAYDKAVRTGQKGETEYGNMKNQLVEIRFRGISKLDVVYDPLEDGAELAFEEMLEVPEAEIRRMIPPQEELEAFTASNPGEERDPDHLSKAVVKEALRMSGTDRSEPRQR
jgi:hypothetical protein